MSSDPGCSEMCPAEFWHLPVTRSVQQFLCLHVGKFLLIHSWNISSFNVWPLLLPCPTEEPLGSFWWLSHMCWHLFGGVSQPCAPSLSQSRSTSSWASWGPVLNWLQFICWSTHVEGAQNWTEDLDAAKWRKEKRDESLIKGFFSFHIPC